MKRKTTGILSGAASWVVLIVDDVPDNLLVITTALKYHGTQVYTATNGEEGLKLLGTVRPTVVLLDIQMPKMNGWEMLKAIRANSQCARIPVIAITAYAMQGDKERILNASFDGYIAKPFDVVTVAEDIKRYVTKAVENTSQ